MIGRQRDPQRTSPSFLKNNYSNVKMNIHTGQQQRRDGLLCWWAQTVLTVCSMNKTDQSSFTYFYVGNMLLNMRKLK